MNENPKIVSPKILSPENSENEDPPTDEEDILTLDTIERQLSKESPVPEKIPQKIQRRQKCKTTRDCEVCCDTKPSSPWIQCPHCEYNSCIDCVERYIIDFKVSQCMECRGKWDFEFLCNNFSKDFVDKRWLESITEILMNQVMAKMPATQDRLDRYNRFL